QYTGRLYAVGAQYLTDDRESRFIGGVRDVVGTAGLERGDGGSLFERRALGRLARNWPLGFQNVQAYHALFGVDQGKADEIKLHQAFQQAAEVGEEGGELAVGDDGFGYFEKRLVAFPGGVRMERCGGWHQGVEPAFPTVPQAGIWQTSHKMARIKGVTATSSTPWACIRASRDSPAGSTKSTSPRSTTVLRPCVVELAVCQHCSSSWTHRPDSRPSSFSCNSRALSGMVLFVMA